MRILVVEDHQKVADFIVGGLREEGYAVDLVADGRLALRQARVEPYDLIVLDVMLPGMDGLEITRRLRERKNDVPILMLTVRDRVADRVSGLDAGADDYLTKPFAFEELVARIRALLRRQGPVSESVLGIADLVLDPVTHSVTRAGKPIELTAKEFSLLQYLMRNKGRIVTRTSIIEHVWDIHFDTDTNIVDVYIRYLRKKIDTDDACRLIKTVRGVGYMLQEHSS